MFFKSKQRIYTAALLFVAVGVNSCSRVPVTGPDKTGGELITGIAMGAGSGAIMGAQYGGATGSGALIGAGAGAVYGIIQGTLKDIVDEAQVTQRRDLKKLRKDIFVQETLNEHYQRRLDLYPSRDIFPADTFFDLDETTVSRRAMPLVKELAVMTKRRKPWSRILIRSFIVSKDPESNYANFLASKRASEISMYFVRFGVEPKRLQTETIIVDKAIVVDPDDKPSRFNQAIEISLLD